MNRKEVCFLTQALYSSYTHTPIRGHSNQGLGHGLDQVMGKGSDQGTGQEPRCTKDAVLRLAVYYDPSYRHTSCTLACNFGCVKNHTSLATRVLAFNVLHHLFNCTRQSRGHSAYLLLSSLSERQANVSKRT